VSGPAQSSPAAGESTGRPERPSLHMLRADLADLPPLAPAIAGLPADYAFRTYRPGDEPGWAALMNTGQMGEWTEERTRSELTGRPWPQFDKDGLFIVDYRPEGLIAGSACAWLLDPAERTMGTLHMVCVLPAHRGQGLSSPLCLAVLHRFRERGYARVRLTTHEWRLGAVKTYLRLGFQPLYSQPLHVQQWHDVLHQLGWTLPVAPRWLDEVAAGPSPASEAGETSSSPPDGGVP
jgi:mycothiol synthase